MNYLINGVIYMTDYFVFVSAIWIRSRYTIVIQQCFKSAQSSFQQNNNRPKIF